MKPSRLQRFFAREWLWTVAFLGGSVGLGLYFAMGPGAARGGLFGRLLGGAFVGFIITWLCLKALRHIIAKINWAPFRVDDTVEVLVGPHRGKIAAVYELWLERGEVRVGLGRQAREDVSDVFSYVQVRRVKLPVPTPPPESSDAPDSDRPVPKAAWVAFFLFFVIGYMVAAPCLCPGGPLAGRYKLIFFAIVVARLLYGLVRRNITPADFLLWIVGFTVFCFLADSQF